MVGALDLRSGVDVALDVSSATDFSDGRFPDGYAGLTFRRAGLCVTALLTRDQIASLIFDLEVHRPSHAPMPVRRVAHAPALRQPPVEDGEVAPCDPRRSNWD